MEYFDGNQFPKFIFYSAHAESVFPFLQSLMYPVMMVDAQPATAAFIEYYEVNGADFVRVYFKMDSFDLDEYTLFDRMPLADF